MNKKTPLLQEAVKRQPVDRLPLIITALIIVAVYLVVFILEQTVDPTHMMFTVLKKGATYALVAVSMNLLNGFTGLFSLGQAGFMLIGAYTYCIFTIPMDKREMVYQYFDGGIISGTVPVVIALIFAGIAAAFFAFFIGLPVLRLKSDYLAIATLGFAEIIRAIMQWNVLGPITNGSNLLSFYPSFSSFKYRDPVTNKVLLNFSSLTAFAIAGVCIAIIVLLVHSTYGRAFKAIRDDEVSAEAMGINLAKHKMQSFIISSAFAGVGGAMLAMFANSIAAKSFNVSMTYEILLIVVIGGIGSITGSIVSAFLFVACSEWWLRFLDTPMTLTPASKLQFVGGFLVVVALFSLLVFLRHRKSAPKKKKRMYTMLAVVDVLLVGWVLYFQFMGGLQMPFLRFGFRLVVFSVVIMIVVLFFSQGLMGTRELPDVIRGLLNLLARFLYWVAKKLGKPQGFWAKFAGMLEAPKAPAPVIAAQEKGGEHRG